jgi:hypothetical protein
MGLEPTFMDLDRQRPDKPQAILRVRKDPNDLGPALELLIEPFKHIGAFEVFMMFLLSWNMGWICQVGRLSIRGKAVLPTYMFTYFPTVSPFGKVRSTGWSLSTARQINC